MSVDIDEISDLDSLLGQENQPTDEVVHQGLGAKADPDGDCPAEKSEGGQRNAQPIKGGEDHQHEEKVKDYFLEKSRSGNLD
jgi:hypothetical protein